MNLTSSSTIQEVLEITFEEKAYEINLELYPGFDSYNAYRWNKNILDQLTKYGGFLDESPDIILTKLSKDKDQEEIILAIEFSSAIQAGNQAWQRSGRALSILQTGCPYMYIVEFGTYELDANRERKSLRVANPIVPYSYINSEKISNIFNMIAYTKSDEFNVKDFELTEDESKVFSNDLISDYILYTIIDRDTTSIEKEISMRSSEIIYSTSKDKNKNNEFTNDIWKNIIENNKSIIDYSLKHNLFEFKKIIQERSHSTNTSNLLNAIENNSVGIGSSKLPFGVIKDKNKFVDNLLNNIKLSEESKTYLNKIKRSSKDLVLCLIKGFKPRGDDNRPDRGILPLLYMSLREHSEVQILTYIYGPIHESNYKLLHNDQKTLAKNNGLWSSILNLTDYVFIDSKIKSGDYSKSEIISSTIKTDILSEKNEKPLIIEEIKKSFNTVSEHDADMVIHYLFNKLGNNLCFESFCNPPGGDWSGIEVIQDDIHYKWLALPRVSADGNKRPDHIIEIFDICDNPVLLSIESKNKMNDFGENIGERLNLYLQDLFAYIPSIEKTDDKWKWSDKNLDIEKFEYLSGGAFISDKKMVQDELFKRYDFDIIFKLSLYKENDKEWLIEIYSREGIAKDIANYIKDNNNINEIEIVIR